MRNLFRPIPCALVLIVVCVTGIGSTQPPPQPSPPQPPPQQPTEIVTTITGEGGAPPHFAVGTFVALSNDGETQTAARTITEVLWDDLNYEREFDMIPRDVAASIPPARSMAEVPFDRWGELNTDGLVIGAVQKTASGLRIEVRLFHVKSRQSVFAKEYTGSAANPRIYAHTASDEIFQQLRALKGVARTKLTFDSDRDGEKLTGTVQNRDVKEIYISDYDGANQRRVTVQRSLNITPKWSPDARGIAYTSYRHGTPDIFISLIYQGTLENPLKGKANNYLPAWSPDGSKICFMSNRDGNPELYVMNRDGSNVRRLTNNPANDSTPTWSPTGNEIAFTSDRSGSPQIYVVDADGLNVRKITSESYCDRPTWSPGPFNEIAYASRSGPGYDIKILDVASGTKRQITFGEGSNESPVFAPNGRHLAFMSTRAGKAQIFTITRDARDLRQITRAGNNYQPDWSR